VSVPLKGCPNVKKGGLAMGNRILIIFVMLVSMTGCASRLVVYSAAENPNVVRGIRVRAPVSYVVTKEIKSEKCPLRIEEEIIHLPAGEPYDITFSPSFFAKNEFSVSFNDNGVLKQVSFNSTPQVAETIKALGELTEKLSAAARLIAKGPEPACGAIISETITAVKRLKASD
jgi:hypothetical protein